MLPFVSVIVPIYKSEEYLSDCLHSLFSQSLSNVEYIFVDDSSPDKSIDLIHKILRLYPKRESQVKLIRHKVNRGVAISRQDGLQSARGEYIIHCDADDWIEQDFLEELYRTAKRDDADVVFCDIQYDSPSFYKRENQKPNNPTSQGVLCELFGRLHGSTCNKLVRNSKIKSLGLSFDPNFNFCEDLLFNTKLFLHPLSISYSPKALYHYRSINSNSVVRNYNPQSLKLDQQLADVLITLVKDTPAEKYCAKDTAYLIAWRAFIGNCFTSYEYKNKIRPYIKDILSANITLLHKAILTLSSLGFYKSVYNLYALYKKI